MGGTGGRVAPVSELAGRNGSAGAPPMGVTVERDGPLGRGAELGAVGVVGGPAAPGEVEGSWVVPPETLGGGAAGLGAGAAIGGAEAGRCCSGVGAIPLALEPAADADVDVGDQPCGRVTGCAGAVGASRGGPGLGGAGVLRVGELAWLAAPTAKSS